MSVESNRAALRKLIRKFPPAPQIDERVRALGADSDMAAAIVGAALIETTLERVLTAKFKVRNASLMGQMFMNRGPLSDFHGKILVATAIGAITTVMTEEMHSMKVIRNVFAHARIPIHFDHELITREIATLKTVNAVKNAQPKKSLNIPRLELTNKSSYLLAIHLHLIIMESTIKHHGTADQAIDDALAADAAKRGA